MGNKKEKIQRFWQGFIAFSSAFLLFLLMLSQQNEGSGNIKSQHDRFLQENRCGQMCQVPTWQQYFDSITENWLAQVISAKEQPMAKYFFTKSKEIETAFNDYSACITSNCGNSSEDISKQAEELLLLNTWFERIVKAEFKIADCYKQIDIALHNANGAVNIFDRYRKDHIESHLNSYDSSLKVVCECEEILKEKNRELIQSATHFENQQQDTGNKAAVNAWQQQANIFQQYCSLLTKKREVILKKIKN